MLNFWGFSLVDTGVRAFQVAEIAKTNLNFNGLEIDITKRLVRKQRQEKDLTFIEFEVLYLLANNPDRVFSKEQIYDIVWKESYSGDYNIVNVEFFVEYKVSNPEQYLYGSYDPETILRNLLQSQVRNVVGSEAVDAVLTTGKESIQMRVKELVAEVLQTYDIGLTLVDVKIQDSDPPTEEVTEAFKAVETAKQQAETVMNEARAYQNAQLPQAEASADELLRNAEYLKQKRINEATEQVAMFEAMFKEYSQNPDITRSRMYYEAISEALPGVKVYINTAGEGGVDMMLPLESFVQDGNQAASGE